jgi:hypothetical protein
VKKKAKKDIVQKSKKIKEGKTKEIIFCGVVALIFVILFVLSIGNNAYVPACSISMALELFCVCYYYVDDENKKPFVFSLFGIGLAFVLFAVIYTLINII